MKLSINMLLFENYLTTLYPDLSHYDKSYKIKHEISNIIVPYFSRMDYLNLVKVANFNLIFEDGRNYQFIHNYQITKLVCPKPIDYRLNINSIVMEAYHTYNEV
eukprot:GHVR01015175.1.p1 GENE.GHVR01015175.1~~GHVR01015175.1.p1  ORF type:complete len:104 (+),score=1.56 GHVR01015175.1:2880-3191(+)